MHQCVGVTFFHICLHTYQRIIKNSGLGFWVVETTHDVELK